MMVLYSNNCPNCRIIKQMLDAKHIEYTENNSVDDMIALGINNVPVLQVENELLLFNEAIQYIRNMEV